MNRTIKHKEQSVITKTRAQIAKGKQNNANYNFIKKYYQSAMEMKIRAQGIGDELRSTQTLKCEETLMEITQK